MSTLNNVLSNLLAGNRLFASKGGGEEFLIFDIGDSFFNKLDYR